MLLVLGLVLGALGRAFEKVSATRFIMLRLVEVGVPLFMSLSPLLVFISLLRSLVFSLALALLSVVLSLLLSFSLILFSLLSLL